MIGKIPPAADDKNENDNRRIAVICDILSNERRVTVIDALEPGEALRITQVLDHFVADTEDKNTRKNINTALYQTHLPQLEAVGVIEYDWDCDEIRCGPQYRLVHDVLKAVRGGS